MAQNMSKRNRRKAGIRIKPHEGLWIIYQLRLKGIKQVDLCRELGVNSSSMTLAIHGKVKSRRIEETICRILGYPTLEAMLAASHGKEEAV